MPTNTTIALDRLIESKASKPRAAGNNILDSKLERRNSSPVFSSKGSVDNDTDRNPGLTSKAISDRKHHWTQISPALYATPDPTPVPGSPSSFPPSPYIVNHKRRGPHLSRTYSDDDVALRQALVDQKTAEIAKSSAVDLEAFSADITSDVLTVEGNRVNNLFNGDLETKDVIKSDAAGQDNSNKCGTLEQDSEKEDFFDPQDSVSIKSSTDGDSSNALEQSVNFTNSASEFYDAWEDLSSESGTQLPPNDVEAELRELRLSLLMEMEKRKQAEDHLNNMRSQWATMREQLSLVGLTLPADPTMLEDESTVEELCRQFHLVRFVSNSIGRGIAKAELQVEMEAQLESKNFEIARLLDRLRYYEAVNQEMSQRNQETVETMRRVRQRRKRRQRWIWGSIAVAIMFGSSALVWSYLPSGKESSSSNPSPSPTSEGNHPAQ